MAHRAESRKTGARGGTGGKCAAGCVLFRVSAKHRTDKSGCSSYWSSTSNGCRAGGELWAGAFSQQERGIIRRQRRIRGRARTAPIEALEGLLNLPAINHECSAGSEHRSQTRKLQQIVGHISRWTLLYGGGNKKGAASKGRAIVAGSGEKSICETRRRRDEMRRRHGIRHRLPSSEPLKSAPVL